MATGSTRPEVRMISCAEFWRVRSRGQFVKRRLIACAASLATSGAAFAHHSGAAYDMTRLVTIEGTVAALAWTNPHIIMTVQTKSADGAPHLQEIEVMSVAQARGLGLRREAISPGARVVVRASPNRRGSGIAFGFEATTSDGARMPLTSFAGFSAAPPPAAEARGLAGRWVPTLESFRRVVAAGAAARLTEAGRAARDEAIGWLTAPGGAGVPICEGITPPMIHVFPDLRTIEIADGTVVIRTETNGMSQARIIHVDQDAHPSGIEPTVEGHSIGRWEGGTLVIDTVGFAPSRTPNLVLVPTHPGTHLIERLTLAQDRRHLEYEFTLDIPEYLVEPATFRATWDYRPDLEPSGVACDPAVARRLLQEQ
jgi:hypothetical protein